jgi:putative membrane protein
MVGDGLDEQDKARVSAAIREAEARTAGEIYVVVARAAEDFRYVPVVWAALAALLLPWPLHLLTNLATSTILIIQAVFFVVTAWGLSHPQIRHRVVPGVIAAEAARRHARALFLAHGVHLTKERTGVLIYVAPMTRRVEIVADVAIHEKVGPSAWEELAQQITTAAREQRLVDGVVGAVRRAGALLAEHFPPRGDNPDELSDRVVEI